MKILLTFIISSLISAHGLVAQTQEQPQPSAAVKSAMQKIAWLQGSWSGEGSIRKPGSQHLFTQQETVSFKANGSVLLIEGLGLTKPGADTVHQALALISYNEGLGKYQMRAVKGDGVIVDATAKVKGNTFIWSMPIGENAQVEYTLTYEDGEWVEVGSYSPDGQQWFPYFNMKLSKLDTDS